MNNRTERNVSVPPKRFFFVVNERIVRVFIKYALFTFLQYAGMKAVGEVKTEEANPLLSFSEVTHTLLNGD